MFNALDQHGIVVDVIAGTSAGAMTGVLYAAGLDCAYLTSQFAADLKPRGSSVSFPTAVTGTLYKYRRAVRSDGAKIPARLEVGATGGTVSHRYVLDLVAGHAVVRDRGDAAHAVLESLNLPMLSAPICRNGQALIDGRW